MMNNKCELSYKDLKTYCNTSSFDFNTLHFGHPVEYNVTIV